MSSSSLPSVQEVEAIAVEACDTRLTAKEHPDGDADLLLAECAENAAVLLRALTVAGITAELAVGAMDIPGEPFPDSPREAVKHGLIHYWVTVETQSGTVMCELASERPRNPSRGGSTTVATSLPPGIIDFGHRFTHQEVRSGDCPADHVVLWDGIRAARDATLEEWGITEQASDCLEGYCHEHAETLLRELVPRWTGDSYRGFSRGDPYIQFGAVTTTDGCSMKDDRAETSVEEILEQGGDHYWVETPFTRPETPGFTADIWALGEHVVGKPIVRRGGLDEYVPASDATVGHRRILEDATWYHAHMN